MSDPDQGTLRDYLRLLRASWRWVVVLAIIGCAAAATYSVSQEDSYVAVARLSFQESGRSNAIAGVAAPQTQTAAQLAAQGAETVLSDEVLRRAKRRLQIRDTLGDMREMLTVDVEVASNLVRIEAESTDQRLAAALANEVATGAVAIQTASEQARFIRAADRLERLFEQLRDGRAGDGAALTLGFVDRIVALRTLGVNATPARVADRADVPSSPASPKPARDTVFGLVMGLLLGVLVAFVRDSLDRRLRESHEIQEELDLPVLGFIRDRAARSRRVHL